MEIEIRVAKVEADVESLKEIARQQAQAIARLEVRMETGFAEQRATMERGFAELRKEMSTYFRWLLGTFLTGFFFLLGLWGRLAGLY